MALYMSEEPNKLKEKRPNFVSSNTKVKAEHNYNRRVSSNVTFNTKEPKTFKISLFLKEYDNS